jgi:hypothetical protein
MGLEPAVDGFDYRPYLRQGEGCLVAYRTDAESVRSAVPESNYDISRSCSSLDEWLWTIARHAIVKNGQGPRNDCRSASRKSCRILDF